MPIFFVGNVAFKGMSHHSFSVILTYPEMLTECREGMTAIVGSMLFSGRGVTHAQGCQGIVHLISEYLVTTAQQVFISLVSGDNHIVDGRVDGHNSVFTTFCFYTTLEIAQFQIYLNIGKSLNTESAVAHDKQYCADNGLQTQAERLKVAGFKRAESAQANGRATAYSNTIKTPMEKAENIGYTKRTAEEFRQTAEQIREEITEYSDRLSKWSGNINTDNSLIEDETLGRKEWSCDITLVDTVDDGVVWHEMLHSCSASYYKPEVYSVNEYIEEATVEWLKQQICKEKNIPSIYSYEDKTFVLQVLNEFFKFGTDMEFAKEIFNIPLPERYQWLENKVDEYLRQAGASFKDYYEVMEFVERLKGGRNG